MALIASEGQAGGQRFRRSDRPAPHEPERGLRPGRRRAPVRRAPCSFLWLLMMCRSFLCLLMMFPSEARLQFPPSAHDVLFKAPFSRRAPVSLLSIFFHDVSFKERVECSVLGRAETELGFAWVVVFLCCALCELAVRVDSGVTRLSFCRTSLSMRFNRDAEVYWPE